VELRGASLVSRYVAWALLAGLLWVAALACVAPASAGAALTAPSSYDRPPPGWRLSAERAITIARRSDAVRKQSAGRHRQLAAAAYMSGDRRWQVGFFDSGREVAQVHIDDRSGRVLEQWTGYQVAWSMARGYPGAFGRVVNAPYVWLPLCALFLLPFFDLRRPFRALHFDLLAVLAFGVSHFFFNRGEIGLSVPLAYIPLAWIAARALCLAVGRGSPRGPLVPHLPLGVVALGALALVAFRIALNVVDSNVIDVGYASVVGADRLVDGSEVYGSDLAPNVDHGDTYGPFTYVAYVPFEQLLPWSGQWDELPAAHAAALTFDLIAMLALLFVGLRSAPGRLGRERAAALAWAWAACPYAAFVVQSNSNDGLVAALLALALLGLSGRRPLAAAAWRGWFVGLAAAAKFVPAIALPILAAGDGRRRALALPVATAVALGAFALPLAVLLPEGGLAEFWQRTIGYQSGRMTPFSIYGQESRLEPVRWVVAVVAVAVALVFAFRPRRRDAGQAAAAVVLAIVAAQVAGGYWFYLYVVWFLPVWLVAVFLSAQQQPADAAIVAGDERQALSARDTRSIARARPSPSASISTP